jgi:hypothetical protein
MEQTILQMMERLLANKENVETKAEDHQERMEALLEELRAWGKETWLAKK